MEKVFGLYDHKDFGSLRTLVTEGKVLFCAADVAGALDYPDPLSAIKRYCKHIEMYSYRIKGGLQITSFTDIDDVLCLISGSKSEDADRFRAWLLGEVVTAVFRDAGLDAAEPYDEDEEYVITLGDFMARIYLEVALYETLNCLIHGIRGLSGDSGDIRALKVFAERSGELVNGAFSNSGITKEFMADSNIDHISELLDDVLLTPEDAGYILAEDAPCCDEDDDEDFFEYDDEDESSEAEDVSAILDCCKRLLSIADAQVGKLAAE